jgi:VanZ family protein
MKFWSIALPLCWAVVVCVLHLVKVDLDPDREKLIPHADKIVHFGMFSSLAFLVYRSFLFHQMKQGTRMLLITIVCCVSYGALMEYLQSMSSNQRDGDVYDWLADVAGAITGAIVATTSWFAFFFGHQVRKSPHDL